MIGDRSCPVCGAVAKKLIHRARQILPEDYPLSGDSRLVVCRVCGGAFADYWKRERDYQRYYADFSLYAEPSVAAGSGMSPWDAARFADVAAFIGERVPRSDSRILDVGCATGGLLRSLRDYGYTNVAGVDPSASCVRFIRETVRADAWVGSIYELPPQIGRFHLATLLEVLEHLEDPLAALLSLREALVSSGVLYIEVPDASRYTEFVLAPWQDFNSEHINHFSWPTLRGLAGRAGLVPISHGTKRVDFRSSTAPVLFGLFRLGQPRTPARADRQLEHSLRLYMRKSETLMDAMNAYLVDLLPSAPRWIVWGTGQLASRLLSDTILGSTSIAAFADNNARNQGKTLQGAPILSPSELPSDKLPILVASTLHEADILESVKNRWHLPNPIYGLRATVEKALATFGETS